MLNNELTQRGLPRVRCLNKAGEVIPPYAVLRIVDTEPGRGHSLKAFKPDGDAEGCTFSINLGHKINDDKAGACTRAYGCWALVDVGEESDPAPGDVIGPDDDWVLHPGKSGFVVIGGYEEFEFDETTYHRVRVMPEGGTVEEGAEVKSWINVEIPAATFDYTAIEATPGIGADAVIEMEWFDDSGTYKLRAVRVDPEDEESAPVTYDGINLRTTPIRASTAEPVIYVGRKSYYVDPETDERTLLGVLFSAFEIRDMPNLDITKDQILYKPLSSPGRAGKLDAEECE